MPWPTPWSRRWHEARKPAMAEATTLRLGGISLSLVHGTEQHFIVPDIGDPASVSPADHPTGPAWMLVPRGHPGSDWARGHTYYIRDFVIDLLRALDWCVAHTCRSFCLHGRGAGGLIAALAATSRPDLITGLRLGAGRGWGAAAELIVSPTTILNRAWLQALTRQHDDANAGMDPMLSYGPPQSLPAGVVRKVLSGLNVPWSTTGDNVIDALLPAHLEAKPSNSSGRAAVRWQSTEGHHNAP